MDQKDSAQETRRIEQKPAEEVFIPEEDTKEKRRAAEAARREKAASAGGRKKKKAPRDKLSTGKARSRREEDQYRPYERANAARKQQRNENLRNQVQAFFSYRNPLAKLFYKEDPNVFGEEDAAERQARRAAEAERKKKIAERLNTPAVIYTQPAAFQAGRLAVHLLTILAVVMAVVMGISVFFKVRVVTVSGAKAYSVETVLEKSGIHEGDNLLTFGRTKASGQIMANLPYVRSVRIGIRLPDTVNIEIEEENVVYSIQDSEGLWWLINSDGKVVDNISNNGAKNYTQVFGVTLYDPHKGEYGVAAEKASAQDPAEGVTDPAMITGSQQYSYALMILRAMEDNDMVGDAASIDVSQLQDIILWYGTRYQVNLGSMDRIDYKIAYMKSAIEQMSEYQSGILDVSFTTWPDLAGFTPFA